MASITLYNKWRPQTFAAPERRPLIGQEHVTRTLRNAVARNQIAHAYLFCGPRGTGKTSAARILARAVNCRRGLQGEPCNECENCQALLTGRQLDLLIEIDGASNRGVDDVRQLRERLMQRPGGADLTGRFKVYIIDEVHMLTQEAFNALLKSLEEPPAHVIFILATTDPQKVPATVASRCQRFDFKPISLETLVAHLVHVAAAEGVRLPAGAAELLAQAAAGGARDAISLLDQALAFTGATRLTNGAADEPLTLGAPTVTIAHVQGMLGLTDFDAVCRLVDALIERDLPTGLRLVHEVADQGIDLRQLTRQIIEFLRALLLAQSDAATLLHLDEERREAVRQRARRLTLADLVRLIRLFTLAEQGLKSPSAQPQLPLELAIVEASLSPMAAPLPFQAEADGPAAPRPQPAVVVASPQHAPPDAADLQAAPIPPRTPPPSPSEFEPPDSSLAPPEASAWPGANHEVQVAPPAPNATSDPAPAAPPPPVAAGLDQPPPAPSRPGPISPHPAPERAKLTLEAVEARWSDVADAVRPHSRTIETLLRQKFAEPVAVEDGNVVVLQFRFASHMTKLQGDADRIAVEKALRRVLGSPCKVRCILKEDLNAPFDRPRSQTAQDDPVVAKALRIWQAHILSPTEIAAVEALPAVTDLSGL